jgi:hypothetical protein
MAETLKTIILLHRVLFIVSLAILAVSLSVRPPITTYAQATAEIENLQEAVAAVSEQVKTAYREIYSRSTLMVAIAEWRRRHGIEEQKIDVHVDNPPEYVVPDAEDNPTVTLGSQIKWADRIYRDIGMPFFLCAVDKTRVIKGLDQMLADNPSTKLQKIRIYIHKEANVAAESQRFSCETESILEESAESFSGNRALNLGIPSHALQVVNTDPWIDLGVEGTLKEHGLGDFEDLHHLGVFSIRDVW